MVFLEQTRGLNENFARELMELHTVGIDGGYTQGDIIEVAKVLTGWTTSVRVTADGDASAGGEFRFDPMLHVDGAKVVLGQTIPSGGIEEGDQLLMLLARHPSTARFISTKLARRFVADEPPVEVVEAASRTFLQTGGDIREVLRTIFTSPQFLSADAYRAKIKKPLELVASSLRAVNAQIEVPPALQGRRQIIGTALGLIIGARNFPSTISQMGERLYDYEAPDGNPDVGAAWMNSNSLLVCVFRTILNTDSARS